MGISVVVDVPEDDVLMRDEVFGPIVVVVPKEVRCASPLASLLRSEERA